MDRRFVLKPAGGKLMGVCSGLAEWSGIDVLIIRLAMLIAALITGPVAVLLYILTGWLAADR